MNRRPAIHTPRMGVDMPLCSRRAWITAARLPTCPRPAAATGAARCFTRHIQNPTTDGWLASKGFTSAGSRVYFFVRQDPAAGCHSRVRQYVLSCYLASLPMPTNTRLRQLPCKRTTTDSVQSHTPCRLLLHYPACSQPDCRLITEDAGSNPAPLRESPGQSVV